MLFLFLAQSSIGASSNDTHYEQMLEEVFRTEMVFPQEKGELQISFLPYYANHGDSRSTVLPISGEYGITDSWQFDYFITTYVINNGNLDLPKRDIRHAQGFGDLELGTKYSFMNINNSNYHAALLMFIRVPTGNVNKGLTEGFEEYSPSVAFARDFPSLNRSQFFGQIGFRFANRVKSPRVLFMPRDDSALIDGDEFDLDPAAHRFFFNTGFFIPVGQARFVLEENWFTNKWNHQGKRNDVYLTPGIVIEAKNEWEFAFGASFGLTPTSDRYDLLLRVTHKFNILHKSD